MDAELSREISAGSTPESNINTSQVMPTITQSRYFSPAFNAAIFDGPLRIYFAQYQESEALKMYFKMQDEMAKENSTIKSDLKKIKGNVFLMIYPNPDIFSQAFESSQSQLANRFASDRMGNDFVIGISGNLEDGDYQSICEIVETGLQISN